jgi:hypothetical protein
VTDEKPKGIPRFQPWEDVKIPQVAIQEIAATKTVNRTIKIAIPPPPRDPSNFFIIFLLFYTKKVRKSAPLSLSPGHPYRDHIFFCCPCRRYTWLLIFTPPAAERK